MSSGVILKEQKLQRREYIVYFLPISIALFLLFLLLIPLLLILMPAVAFAKMGLSPFAGLLFYLSCLFGSVINIPIYREKLPHTEVDEFIALFQQFFRIRLPAVRERIIAINLGGAILPILLSIYLLTFANITATAIATIITTICSYILSKPVRGVGIVMPAFIPPIIAAIAALIFARENAAPVAYISGVLGTLIGADILRLPKIKEFNAPILSIGGAGVFDGIFLVGIISALLA